MTRPIPIQLALQGGGARIAYLIAALHAVQELEREHVLRVTRIAGTSAGALAGALYAARVDMGRARDALLAERETLLRAFPSAGATLRDAWRLLTRRPLWNPEPLRRLLGRLLAPRETFRDLDIPLIVVGADLTNLQSVVYGRAEDPLLSSIMDSAGIPFLFRSVPPPGPEYRVIVDGGVCDNLPSEQLADSPGGGEVLGITFSVARAGAPLSTFSDYVRALVETAINASVLRAQLQLGINSFVIRTATRSLDFAAAIDAAGGAEYRETRLLAGAFFRAYAERTARAAAGARGRDRDGDARRPPGAALPEASAAPASEGSRMSPSELLGYPAPAGYFTVGWKGEDIPPNTLFGCNLIRRDEP